MAENLFLEMKGITKTFPGVTALDEVTFAVRHADIHALVGENGAGKSTLMKILCGCYGANAYKGEIFIEGKACRFESLQDAEREGISIIFQELNLVRNLSVAENIFLGRLPGKFGFVDWNSMHEEASHWLGEVGLELDPDTQMGALAIGKRQLVEIAKALSKNARLLVFDEPTSSLTSNEIENLFQVLEMLKRKGVTCIYISHKLKEVFRVADMITVLRDGRSIHTAPKSELSESSVVAFMVGREIKNIYPRVAHTLGRVVLEVKGLTLISRETNATIVKNATFSVRSGEILGIAGLMGAGRTALLFGIFGAFRGTVAGKVLIEGREAVLRSPADAIARGLSLVPEDRRTNGLIMSFSAGKNVTLASLRAISRFGVLNQSTDKGLYDEVKERLDIKAPSFETGISNLSGGTQQKVVIGRWLARGDPLVLFLDEPTNGIDVGAKYEMYCIMQDLASRGIGVVLVSSELQELLGVCDRILVMREGEFTGNFARDEVNEEKIMYAATIGS